MISWSFGHRLSHEQWCLVNSVIFVFPLHFKLLAEKVMNSLEVTVSLMPDPNMSLFPGFTHQYSAVHLSSRTTLVNMDLYGDQFCTKCETFLLYK